MIPAFLTRHYSTLDTTLPIRDDDQYGCLVVPNSNGTLPVHRWFHQKESFSAALLPKIMSELRFESRRRLTILDSFAGVGTTLVSALQFPYDPQRELNCLGIERNPFLRLVADAKIAAVQNRPTTFVKFIKRVRRRIRFVPDFKEQLPRLSTFANPKYFSDDALQELVALKCAIESVDGTIVDRKLALVCLASVIEPASGLRRDGRALRYEPKKERAVPVTEFINRARIIAEDLEALPSPAGTAAIREGDGRYPFRVFEVSNPIDLVLFSPPYPNNIDYTEVYKLEAWFLDLIRNPLSFRSMRLGTIRSHPSVRFPEFYANRCNNLRDEFDFLVQPIVDAIPHDEDYDWRRRLVLGYFDDMAEILRRHLAVLATDGYLVFVVGNSLHGNHDGHFLIAADVIMAKLAEYIGFDVLSLRIARRPTRKRSDDIRHLRESVVFLKPRSEGVSRNG